MHLIDPQDPFTMAAVDPAALAEMADFIIASAFGSDWRSEESGDEHAYHDGTVMHPECAHCAIYGYHRGQGHQIARAQLAMTILSAGGPVEYMSTRRMNAAQF